MDQMPKKFGAGDYVLAIVGVIGGNILCSVAVSKIFHNNPLPAILVLVANIFLYFYFRKMRSSSDPWTIGFLVYLCLAMIPILFFLGLLGLCMLTSGN